MLAKQDPDSMDLPSPYPTGPVYLRRRRAPPAAGLYRLDSCDTSSLSSRGGTALESASAGGSSRGRVALADETPLAMCCAQPLRRSSMQTYGMLVSLARMVAYAIIIGSMASSPDAQVRCVWGGSGKWKGQGAGLHLCCSVHVVFMMCRPRCCSWYL